MAIPTPTHGSVGVIALVVIALTGCAASGGSEGEAIIRIKPQPVLREDSKELSLLATGVEGCLEADRKVTDVHVEESASEVTVRARLNLSAPGLFCDESGTAGAPFVVRLRKPLGGRTIVDGSRGQPISTAERRKQIRQAFNVKASEVERFAANKEPNLSDVKCFRFSPERFQCQGRRGPRSGRREFVSVVVLPGLRLKLVTN